MLTWWTLNGHPNVLPLFGYAEEFGTFGAMVSPVCPPSFTCLHLVKCPNLVVQEWKLCRLSAKWVGPTSKKSGTGKLICIS